MRTLLFGALVAVLGATANSLAKPTGDLKILDGPVPKPIATLKSDNTIDVKQGISIDDFRKVCDAIPGVPTIHGSYGPNSILLPGRL